MRIFIRLAAPATALSRAIGRIPIHKGIPRFLADDGGSVSVAYVLWSTLFVAIFTVVADLSSLFVVNTEMWHVAHDAARRLSVADMTASEAEAFVRLTMLDTTGTSVNVTATTGEMVVVEITAPYEAATIFGVYEGIDVGTLEARAVMRDEVAAMAELSAGEEQLAQAGTSSGE